MNENNNVLGQSFDDIVAAIQKKNSNTTIPAPITTSTQTGSVETPVQNTSTSVETPVQAAKPVQNTTTSVETPVQAAKPVAKMTFEELVAQAKAAAAGVTAPADTPASETSVEATQTAKTIALVETPKTVNEPAQTVETVTEETQAAEEAPVGETVTTEETQTAEEAPVEDKTDEYLVDLTPTQDTSVQETSAEPLATANADELPVMTAAEPAVEEKPKKKRNRKSKAKVEATIATETVVEESTVPAVSESTTSVQETATVQVVERAEAVFGKEEVEEMRTILRSWLRHELKLAMVEAMKDITRDFNV